MGIEAAYGGGGAGGAGGTAEHVASPWERERQEGGKGKGKGRMDVRPAWMTQGGDPGPPRDPPRDARDPGPPRGPPPQAGGRMDPGPPHDDGKGKGKGAPPSGGRRDVRPAWMTRAEQVPRPCACGAWIKDASC
jgi:hypothetical protein